MDMLGDEESVGEDPRAVAGRLLTRLILGGMRIARALELQA